MTAPRRDTVYLALRRTASDSAHGLARLACWAIRVRLVSAWCHGGVVVNGDMLHATSSAGLIRVRAGLWEPHKWDLIPVPNVTPHDVLDRYAAARPARYDWLSLLAFVLPGRWRDSRRLYCFEWCHLALTGQRPPERCTPERLLWLARCRSNTTPTQPIPPQHP